MPRERILSDTLFQSDFVSKTLTIPAEYHRYISGPKNTTLNAILGSETSVSVRFGGQSEDAVTVRGPVDEVNKAITQINKIHEAAQRKEVTKGKKS